MGPRGFLKAGVTTYGKQKGPECGSNILPKKAIKKKNKEAN